MLRLACGGPVRLLLTRSYEKCRRYHDTREYVLHWHVALSIGIPNRTGHARFYDACRLLSKLLFGAINLFHLLYYYVGETFNQTKGRLMTRSIMLFALVALSLSPNVGAAPATQCRSENRAIDLAICLDISGSMSDLLDSVRGRVWDIVTDLSRATPTPSLRVALITFGGEVPAEDGYIVRHVDFTGDLDTAYGKLMALNTDGGEEYVGWAIERAVESLDWSSDPDALRIIFLAGNESADQLATEHDFRIAARAATDMDIIINSVYAGDREQGVAEKWDRVAQISKGTYTAIDVVSGTIQIDTPYDATLAGLNGELNRTYIPFGAHGATGLANQIAQDKNAAKMGAQSCGSRAAAKGCALYNAATWDLVDALRQKDFRLAAIESNELPAFMRSMTPDQRRTYVVGMQSVRDAVRAEIAETDQQRRAFIQAKQAQDRRSRPSFDDALLTSLRAQAVAKGFTYPAPAPVSKVEVVTEIQGPQIPLRLLKTPVQANVDALIAANPVLEYGVVDYRSRRLALAEHLADRVGAPIRILLGDREFASASLAHEALLELLRGTVDELRTIRIVNATPIPFVYAASSGATAPAKGDVTCFRIGGIDFADRTIAERARNDIQDALKLYAQKQVNTAQPRGSARLVSSKKSDSLALQQSIELCREQIKIIAETTGWSYMTLVDGC